MAEQPDYDDEERAWAMRVARAFLAPPQQEQSLPEGASLPAEGLMAVPAPGAVLLVAVVPLAVPPEARGDEAMRRRGDERQEEEGDG